MRFLILSDIHSNWEALQAVLADADGQYDQILCCGDLVGYGADPDIVTEWVMHNTAAVVRGNHDKACAGLENLEWFNPVARISALWTQSTAKAANVAYLGALRQGPRAVDGFQILHGSPADEDEYLVSADDAARMLPYLTVPVSFFGHTHLQGGFELVRQGVRTIPGGRHDLELYPDRFYLINPGSVGQPRDGDPWAAYAVYTPDEHLVRFRRVAYDLAGAQRKIRGAGLPEVLATRLETGL